VSWKQLKYREVYLAVSLGAEMDVDDHWKLVDYLSANPGEYEGLLRETLQLESTSAKKALDRLLADVAKWKAWLSHQNVCQAVASAQLH
jgi:hypothetical protein